MGKALPTLTVGRWVAKPCGEGTPMGSRMACPSPWGHLRTASWAYLPGSSWLFSQEEVMPWKPSYWLGLAQGPQFCPVACSESPSQ